jgi:class 3 adenylate cyclase/tetratricopeptide (TPR) repeat protein
MRCSVCHADRTAEAKHCEECGAALVRICPHCGREVSVTAKYCEECGQSLATPLASAAPQTSPHQYTPTYLADKILTSRSALQGELKQVTVLFCDIANSTPMAERLGPERMHALLDRFFDLALDEIHRYEGTVNQFLGDGFMAIFGAPLAHEDHARRAALAALGIQRTLQERATSFGLPPGYELSLRMGMNTGLVVVGKIGDNLRMDYTAVGDTTNLASRLQSLAEPGAILVGESTSRHVRGYVRLESLGALAVKGKADPVPAYKVLGVGSRRSPLEDLEQRPLGQFVGRERELAELHELLSRAERGEGRAVGIVGEPGVGKSRLLYQFAHRLAGDRVTYVEGRCVSYGGNTPYLPVLDLLRNNCQITDTDPPEVVADKVRATLGEVGIDPQESAPYLLRLLGLKDEAERLDVLTAEAVRARTFEILRQMCLAGSRRQPLVLAVEDVHWIDKISEAYFTSLAERLDGTSILLVTTYRHGYQPPWIEKPCATQLALRPLSPADGLVIMQSVVQQHRLPDTVATRILERAEGNPFFVEELTRAVLEQIQQPERFELPDTIQAVLMARIDRLSEGSKRMLQTASVLGRECASRLLEAIWEGPGGLEPHLQELMRLGFLYERTGGTDRVFVFMHALTQEVAYASLLTSYRQTLHAAAGRALEALYAERLEEVYDRLAYHYGRTDEAAKAVEYLTRSAEKALRVHAAAEAAMALQEALTHAERLPTEQRDQVRLELILRLVHAHFLLGRFPESLDLLFQERERAQLPQNATLRGAYYFWLGHTYSYLGDMALAAENARRAIREATRCGDIVTRGRAHYVLGRSRAYSCRFREGIKDGRRAAALLEQTQERWWLGQAHWVVALNYILAGEFKRGFEATDRARAIGELIGDIRLQCTADWTNGLMYALSGESKAAIEVTERSLEHAPDPFTTTVALGMLGYTLLSDGDVARALPLLEQAVERLRQSHYSHIHGSWGTWLSEALLLSGRIDEAREVALECLEITREAKFPYGVAWAQRILGRIAQAAGDLSDAQIQLTEAASTFAAIGSRGELGRTHLALASLAAAQANRDAATTHLRKAAGLFQVPELLKAPKLMAQVEQLAIEIEVPLVRG